MSLPKIINLALPTVKKIFHITEKRPRFVQISFTNHCNLSCKMCIRNYIEVDRRHMRWEDFVTVVDKLDGAEQVSLAGMGESLTHPQIFEAIAYCKSKGFKVQLTSNALLLGSDEIIERLIRSGIDSMSFSIESITDNYDMGHGNARAIANIKRLVALKRTLGSKTPKIVLQPILFKDKEKDVYEIIRWGAQNGVDRINVVRVDLRFVPDMKRPTADEEGKIFKEFGRLRRQHRIRIDCLQDQIFDGLAGLIYKYTKRLLRLDSWCYRFQDFIYINVNGNVHPCCFSEEQVMGNLLRQDLKDIWHGEKFRHLRKNQESYAYCKKCDFLRLRQVV